MKRFASALAVAAIAAAGMIQSGARVEAAVTAGCGVDMKVLVISADGQEADLPGITTTLDYLGHAVRPCTSRRKRRAA